MKKNIVYLFLLIAVLSVGLGSCKKNDDTVYTFRLRLNTGDEFSQNYVNTIEVKYDLFGQEMKVPTTMEFLTHFNVLDSTENTYTVSFMYDRIMLKVSQGLISYNIDSDTQEEKATMTDLNPLFKAMTGKPVTVVLDKQGKVISSEGYERMISGLADAMDENFDSELAEQIIAALFEQSGASSSILADQMIAQLLFYMPSQPVKVGDRWEVTGNLLGGTQGYEHLFATLKSVKGNVARIELEGNFSVSASGSEMADVIKENIFVDVDGTQKGVIRVDLNNGLPVNVEIKQYFTGTAIYEGMRIPQQIKSDINITLL